MRVVAAIKWYETGRVSQGKGAEIAGLSRAEFISAMLDAKVSPSQYTANDLQDELLNADCPQVLAPLYYEASNLTPSTVYCARMQTGMPLTKSLLLLPSRINKT